MDQVLGFIDQELKGYLPHLKAPPPRTLQLACSDMGITENDASVPFLTSPCVPTRKKDAPSPLCVGGSPILQPWCIGLRVMLVPSSFRVLRGGRIEGD